MEIKIYFKSILGFILPLLILLLIINTLYFFDYIDNNIIKFLKIIIVIFSSFISGFIRGYNSISKGYISGLKLSGIIILFLFVFCLVLKSLKFSNIIYYLIITLTITFGSMVGINKKSS